MKIDQLRRLRRAAAPTLLFWISIIAAANPVLAQSVRSAAVIAPTPSATVTASRNLERSLFTGKLGRPAIVTPAKPVASAWLWFVLGGLTAWNILLSYLVWKNFENFDRKTYRHSKKLKELEAKDITLDHRIDRRTTDIDELARKADFHEAILSQLQPDFRQMFPATESAQSTDLDSHSGQRALDSEYSQSFDAAFGQTSDSESSQSLVTEPWDSIIQSYRHSPEAFESYIIEKVSETEESLAGRRNSSQAPVLLKSATSANYWIFNGADQHTWLVPKHDLKLTPISYDTFQALFECQDYQPNLKLQILRPAKVSFNPASDAWELEIKGLVQFDQ